MYLFLRQWYHHSNLPTKNQGGSPPALDWKQGEDGSKPAEHERLGVEPGRSERWEDEDGEGRTNLTMTICDEIANKNIVLKIRKI